MNDDFKHMLDEALKPIKDDQAALRKKVDEVGEGQKSLQEGYKSLKQDVADLKNTIESRVLPPLVYIETTVKGYADMYKINDSNSRRMEKRLETVEDKENIDVPPEFKLEPLPESPTQP